MLEIMILEWKIYIKKLLVEKAMDKKKKMELSVEVGKLVAKRA